MGKLRVGDVYERDASCTCGAMLCSHMKLRPRWRIWLAWFFRMLGWDGDPT